MEGFNSNFLDKVLGRIDRLNAEGLQSVVARLEEQRQFFETVFNVIEDCILVVNPVGKLLYCNRAAFELLGIPHENYENKQVTRFIPDLNWEKLVQSIGEDQSSRMVRLEFDIRYPKSRFVRLFASAIERQGNQHPGFVLVLHDVTETRKQTYEAIESERVHTLTLLAGSVAHEIGNPLNALHIHLQLISRETAKLREAFENQSRQKKRARGRPRLDVESEFTNMDLNKGFNRLESFIETSRGEINRLEYIITQFLQAIRPSSPDRKPDQINKVVLETLDLLRPELDNRNIELIKDLDDHLPDTPFDRSQIKQVFVNLIKNAMQAITQKGVLTIRTKGEVEGVLISIEDNGAGIPSERISRIFEPYFTTKKKGTGLGLMIVHRIIRDHGGRIMVEPNHPEGTVFRVWLPLFEKQKRLLGAGVPSNRSD